MSTIDGSPPLVFQRALEKIGPDEVRELPYIADEVAHDGMYTQLSGLEPGLYVDRCYFDPVESSGGLGHSRWRFTLQNGMKVTREDSRHGAFFGTVHGEAGNVRVGVKSARANLGELALFQYIADRGLATYMPVFYLQEENNVGHLGTLFDDGTQTLDALDWFAMTDEEAWFQVGYAVETMVETHKHMLFHGDLMFRNVAIDQTGGVFIVDPELAVSRIDQANAILKKKDPELVEQHVGKIVLNISTDFEHISKSLDRTLFNPKRLGGSIPLDIKQKQLKHNLYDKYKTSIQEQDGKYIPLLIELYDRVLAKKKARFAR